jgi:hypothetical protein
MPSTASFHGGRNRPGIDALRPLRREGWPYRHRGSAEQYSEDHGPSTINVSGACHENVLFQNVDRLTIAGSNGASITDASGGAPTSSI